MLAVQLQKLNISNSAIYGSISLGTQEILHSERPMERFSVTKFPGSCKDKIEREKTKGKREVDEEDQVMKIEGTRSQKTVYIDGPGEIC